MNFSFSERLSEDQITPPQVHKHSLSSDGNKRDRKTLQREMSFYDLKAKKLDGTEVSLPFVYY